MIPQNKKKSCYLDDDSLHVLLKKSKRAQLNFFLSPLPPSPSDSVIQYLVLLLVIALTKRLFPFDACHFLAALFLPALFIRGGDHLEVLRGCGSKVGCHIGEQILKGNKLGQQ